jgi:hypothetical protein
MGIEGGIVGSGAGGAPVSMELLQLIAADPAEFQRRMALIEQAKKDFDEQLEKNNLVGDILALRKEAAAAVDKANSALENANNAVATLLSDAAAKADRLIAAAQAKAEGIVNDATTEAEEQRAAAKAVLSDALEKAAAVESREAAAEATMKDAEAKYASIEPDRKMFQEATAKAERAAELAEQAKAAYEAKCADLVAVSQQIAKALSGAA